MQQAIRKEKTNENTPLGTCNLARFKIYQIGCKSMEASATITRKNVGTDDEEFTMSYRITGAKNDKKLCELKDKFDKVVVKAGGQTTLDSSDEDDD